METKMTINGVSTCTALGTEKYEKFYSGRRPRKAMIQYDYRHTRTVLNGSTHFGAMQRETQLMVKQEREQAMNKPIYQTMKVVFAEPIRALNEMFSDTQSWGVSTLKEWIDGYESTRFTAIDGHTAIITSEYNMECVKEWFGKNTPIYTQIEL